MNATGTLDGFAADAVALPMPQIEVSEEARGRMRHVMAAVVLGATPEEVAEGLASGFDASVRRLAARPLDREEFDDLVDLLLSAQN